MSEVEAIDKAKFGRFHYLLLGILGTVWAFIAINTLSVSFVIPLISKEPAFQASLSKLGAMGSAALWGMLVGAWSFGTLSDYLGRKKALGLAISLFGLGSIASSFAGTLDQLIGLRFIVGLGLGGALPVASSYFAEFMPTKIRGAMISVLESFWAIGTIIIGIVAIILKASWRSILLFGGSVLALLPLVLWLPESPRFLALKGKTRDAEKILERIFGVKAKLEQPQKIRTKVTVLELWQRYGKITLMLSIAWFSIAFAYYGFFVWLPKFLAATLKITVFKSFQYFIITAIAQLPGYWSAAYLLEKIGRRKTLSGYLLLSGLAGVMFYNYASSGNVSMILTSAVLFSFFNLGAWGAIYAYTPELYPTEVRGSGAGWAGAMARIGGGLAPILAGRIMETSTVGVAVLAIAIVSIIGAFDVFILGEETKGIKLA
ncbi:MFS transporter [Thermococcus argininiproducens]|uniref:MFS transporter n=1 Tax=Thermococcus argininiproducens TaxID=2866384 RepID=UPI00311A997E